MANIPIRDIPGGVVASPGSTDRIAIDNGSNMQQTTIANAVNAAAPVPSQSEAETGSDNTKRMTSLRTKQSIASQVGVTLASKAQGDKADTAVQPARQVIAGSGLTGGGDLSADRTLNVGAGTGITVNADDVALSAGSIASLALADSAVQPSRQVIAGDGLTGGGALSADVTLNVGAGTGLTVAADTIGLDTTTQSRLLLAGGTTGQVLAKNSGTDYDVTWQTVAAATAVSYAVQSLTSPQQLQARTNIGLSNVGNTSDANKPVSTAQATAIALKSDSLQPFQSIASAATTNIGGATSESVLITGTTTITSLGTATAGTFRRVRMAGALTLTYNATSLILPGLANIVTVANDCFDAVSLGSENWIITDYQPAKLTYSEGTTTPTVTADSGTITTSSCTLDYVRTGRQVAWSAIVTITTAGTGSGAINIPLPFTAAKASSASAREVGATGVAGSASIGAASATCRVTKYDNATLIVTGYIIYVSGIYFA